MDLIAIIKFVLAPLKIKSLGDWLQDLQPGGKRTAQVLSVENDGRVPVDLGVDADIPAELYRRQRRS